MIGRNHPLVRRLRELRREPAAREREDVFVAEGVHLAQEALAAGASIEGALVSPRLGETAEGRALKERLSAARVPLEEASDAILDAVQDARSPQPVVIVIRRRGLSLSQALEGRAGIPLVLVAHGIQDPGNLGSLWRTADAAGATAFVATGSGADLHHPRVVRATAGSVFRIPAVSAGLDETLAVLRSRNVRTAGTSPAAGASYTAVDWRGPWALILGSEGAGLEPRVLDRLDARVAIPMHPGVESLSVAAAGAVVLFEAARQRSRA